MSDLGDVIIGFFIGVVVTFALMASVGTPTHAWHKEAIDRKYAEYDKTTGAWQWIEPKKETAQ